MSSDFVNNGYDQQAQIDDIIKSVWGYKNFTYLPRTSNVIINKESFDPLKAVDYKFQDKTSYIGTPIKQPLKLQLSPRGQAVEMFDFPNEPIVEINGVKKIAQTELSGNDGDFLELYSLGNYAITIRGVAVNENHDEAEDYPEDFIRKFRTAFELRNHLQVSGALFSIFNIKYISLTSFSMPRIEGAIGMQPYEFQALSDKIFDLELKKKK